MINLGTDDIHVWTGGFDADGQDSDRMTLILSQDEIRRARAFRFEQDQSRYIQAHAVLRLLLSKYAGIVPQNLKFQEGLHGKPALVSVSPLYFNLSHTKDMMAVALSSSREIGVDIEKQDDMQDMEGVARQFMSEDEFRNLAGLDASAQKKFFYGCWVRKEALLKAAGTGLIDHIRQVSVMQDEGWEESLCVSARFEGTSGLWRLETFYPALDHAGAIGFAADADNANYSIIFKRIHLKELFEGISMEKGKSI